MNYFSGFFVDLNGQFSSRSHDDSKRVAFTSFKELFSQLKMENLLFLNSSLETSFFGGPLFKRFWMIGIRKEAVFPEPVCEEAMIFNLALIIGIEFL